MSKKAVLKVEDGEALGTLRGFLRHLLEREIVDALLVPLEVPSGDNIVQTLIRDPSRLERANPLAPVMAVNSATLVSNLTGGGLSRPVGAVLKSCEIRALIELVKLQQARLDNLMIIGIDCLGTYEVTDYAQLSAEIGDEASAAITSKLLEGAESAQPVPWEGYVFRSACQICEQPLPQDVDLSIGLIGVDVSRGALLTMSDEVAEQLELAEEEAPARDEAVAKLVEERAKKRDEVFGEFRERVTNLPSLLAQFSTCTRCHNCMVACPICYCKECLFRTAIFEHQSDQYLRWAERKGAIRMPTDTLLYQLTRLNHMVSSCVGCGMCESACPSRLPLTTIFRAVGQQVQAMFDYVPGRSLEEEIPLATFREDELTNLGERG